MIRKLINKWNLYMDSEHTYPAEKLDSNQFIAVVVFAYPILGFLYLKLYFEKFNIDYFNHFELGDAVYIMYKMAIPLIFVLLLLSLVFCYLVYLFIENKSTKKES